MTRKLIPVFVAGALAVASGVSTKAQDHKNEKDRVQVSGMTQGNTGCAILEKHTPVKGKLLFAGVIYARTEYKVFQAFNASLPREKFTGPGEIKELNDLAVKDKIKLVVIPTNYSDDELERARSMCGQPPTPPPGATPPAQ
jgi:hypothetical protein